MGTRLFVGNLSYGTTEADLHGLFGQIGTVAEVKIVSDRETGRPRGFAFVEMSSAGEAAAAIEQVHGRELGGRTLNVNEATSKPTTSRAPRGGDRRW